MDMSISKDIYTRDASDDKAEGAEEAAEEEGQSDEDDDEQEDEEEEEGEEEEDDEEEDGDDDEEEDSDDEEDARSEDATDTEPSPAPEAKRERMSDVNENRTLFVRGVPFDATEDDIKSAFTSKPIHDHAEVISYMFLTTVTLSLVCPQVLVEWRWRSS